MSKQFIELRKLEISAQIPEFPISYSQIYQLHTVPPYIFTFQHVLPTPQKHGLVDNILDLKVWLKSNAKFSALYLRYNFNMECSVHTT